MSIPITEHIWQNSKQKGNTLLLLLAIAKFTDDCGWAYPSVATLAKLLRMSDRNVRKLIDQVEADQELIVFNFTSNEYGGRHFSNMYFIPSSTSVITKPPERSHGFIHRRNVSPDTVNHVSPDITIMSHQTLPNVPPDTTIMSHQTSESLKESLNNSIPNELKKKDSSPEILNGYFQATLSKPRPEVWTAVCSQYEAQDKQNFNQWLRGAVVQSSGETTPNAQRWVIGVRDQLAADMCNSRLMRSIKNILIGVLGLPLNTPLELVFEAPEAVTRPAKRVG